MRDGTKTELQEIAFDLFQRRGFDAVSIAQIAEAAGVSQRTFFRYFATKEDVILENIDDTSPMIRDALRAAPAELTPLQALRAAFSAIDRSHSPLDRGILVMTLALNSAKLRAGLNERRLVWEANLAHAIAERLGVTVEEDIRPSAWASAVIATVTAVRNRSLLLDSHNTPRDPSEIINAAFDALETLSTTNALCPAKEFLDKG
jgi:AcrR family transcriptional regulator